MCINTTYVTRTVFGNSDTGIVDVNPTDCVGLYPQLGGIFIFKYNPCSASAILPPLHSHSMSENKQVSLLILNWNRPVILSQ